jgi:anaerobic magnesium-protoporphyrin IX monomethyl ester cyclase
MRILLVNVPHTAIGSRIPDDHLPPLGLLAVGGPLIDDGHEVRLIDAEFGPMPLADIIAEAAHFAPEAVLFGHSGSTSAHPVIAETARAFAGAFPGIHIVYGGVFPTYHWREILETEPHVTNEQDGVGDFARGILLRRAKRDEMLTQFGQRLIAGEAEILDGEIALAQARPGRFGHGAAYRIDPRQERRRRHAAMLVAARAACQ